MKIIKVDTLATLHLKINEYKLTKSDKIQMTFEQLNNLIKGVERADTRFGFLCNDIKTIASRD